MLGYGKGWVGCRVRWSLLLAGSLRVLTGCSGGEVSAGEEGDYINLGRCFGADCGARVQTSTSEEAELPECGEARGELETLGSFDLPELLLPIDIQAAPDGSVWVLAMTQQGPGPAYEADFYEAPVLVHYAADGQLIGTTGIIEQSQRSSLEVRFAVDAAGNAAVGVYEIWAETADSEVVEHLNLYTYGPDLEPLGANAAFRGVADAHLAGNVSGDLWLAGNADEFGAHGVLARLTQGEPQWIQTNVRSSGRRAGVGVSDVAVSEDGHVAVVTKINPRWNGGPDVDTFALSAFDDAGNAAWSLELPTPFGGGERVKLASSPAGDWLVAGKRPAVDGVTVPGSGVVRRVTRSGKPSWGYRLDAVSVEKPSLASDGRIFVAVADGVAVISADGQRCHRLTWPGETPWGTPLIAVTGNSIFLATDALVRYALPED